LITKVSNNCFFVQLRASRTTAATAHSAQLATTEAHVAHHTAAKAVHQVHAWRLSDARSAPLRWCVSAFWALLLKS
jgi:hypothetical protein